MSPVQAEIRRPSVLKKSTPFELMGPNVSKAIGMKVWVWANEWYFNSFQSAALSAYYYYHYYYTIGIGTVCGFETWAFILCLPSIEIYLPCGISLIDNMFTRFTSLTITTQCFELQFVAHPNCQQHLTTIWFGPQMGFMQSLTLWKKIVVWLVCVPLLPIFCFVYIIAPSTKVKTAAAP